MDKLFDKLKLGPAVLFLGQGYMKMMTGREPFIDSMNDYFSEDNDACSIQKGYDNIFDISANIETENLLKWMQKRAERISVPDEIQEIAKEIGRAHV